MKDLKSYAKLGKFEMAHTLQLCRAIEHLLEERMKKEERPDHHYDGSSPLATPPANKYPHSFMGSPHLSSAYNKRGQGRIGVIKDVLTTAMEVLKEMEDDDDEGDKDMVEDTMMMNPPINSVLMPERVPLPLPSHTHDTTTIRDSTMTNIASIARSKALQSDTFLKTYRRPLRPGTGTSNLHDSPAAVDTYIEPGDEEDVVIAPKRRI